MHIFIIAFFNCLTFEMLKIFEIIFFNFYYGTGSINLSFISKGLKKKKKKKKKTGYKYSSLMILERLFLTTVPYICIMYVLPCACHCALHCKVNGVSCIHISIAPNLWYYCIVVRRVGSSLCSQMWQGYLSCDNTPWTLSHLSFSSSKLCFWPRCT